MRTLTWQGERDVPSESVPEPRIEDPLGVDDAATHRLPLEEGPQAYKNAQDKRDGMITTLLIP